MGLYVNSPSIAGAIQELQKSGDDIFPLQRFQGLQCRSQHVLADYKR